MNFQSKSILVIYNPIAGYGRTLQYWPHIQEKLNEANIKFDAVATGGPLEAVTIAKDAGNQYSTIIGIGGDGTVNEILNGLMRASGEQETISFGVIPLGNGDDFAKMIPPETPIGGRPFDWKSAINKIKHGQTQLFDVGRIKVDQIHTQSGSDLHYFANSFDVGFGAQGAQNMSLIPKFFKGFSGYLASLVVTLFNYPKLKLSIQLDEREPFTQLTTMAAVMNGRSFGNGFWISPEANITDGLFDLLVCKAIGPLTIMRLVPKLMKGTHLGDPVIDMYRAQRVVIDSPIPIVVETDGEIAFTQARHIEIEVLPKKLRVIV